MTSGALKVGRRPANPAKSPIERKRRHNFRRISDPTFGDFLGRVAEMALPRPIRPWRLEGGNLA